MCKKLIKAGMFFAFFSSLSFSSFAAERIWKQNNNPANSVSLEKVKDEVAEELILNHPYTLEARKLVDMLLSVRYSKALLFRKDIKDQQVFFDIDLIEKKFAAPISEALQKANPQQVVVVSMVQKDPLFILRNDRLNIFKIFVAQDGLHIKFLKMDSQLTGDYQAHSTGTKLVQNAKGLKISLEPQLGQKLSFNDTQEIILDLNYDFAAQVEQKVQEEETIEKEKKSRVKRSESSPKPIQSSVSSTLSSSEVKKTPAQRLKDLKELKDKGLITNSEYETKKKEILKDL